MKIHTTRPGFRPNVFLWIALATGLVLLIPLGAMQFNDDVVWTPADFAFAATLISGTCALFVLAARKIKKYRLALGAVFAVAFLYVWAEFAVGVFTGLGS